MNTPHPVFANRTGAFIVLSIRMILGALFIYMGMVKALHPADFLKLLHQYTFLPGTRILTAVAAILPWLEVFCGLLFLAGIGIRGTALVLILLLVPFTTAIFVRAHSIQQVQPIPFCAIRFDCGCGAGEVNVCRKLFENFILLILSGIVLLPAFASGRRVEADR